MSDVTSGPDDEQPAAGSTAEQTPAPPDLDLIEADLAGVEAALERLDTGGYWRDEITGEALDVAVLDERPTARRNPT